MVYKPGDKGLFEGVGSQAQIILDIFSSFPYPNLKHIDSVELFDDFRALKSSLFDDFRALKFETKFDDFSALKSSFFECFRALKSSLF